jgi:hypothetical protein
MSRQEQEEAYEAGEKRIRDAVREIVMRAGTTDVPTKDWSELNVLLLALVLETRHGTWMNHNSLMIVRQEVEKTHGRDPAAGW